MSWYREYSLLILDEIRTALGVVDEQQVDRLVDALLEADKVFLLGVGRVLLSLQAFAKRLNHLGVRAWWVGEINEPAATASDLVIVGSGSGESVVPVAIARVAKRHGARVVHIGSNPASSLAPLADLFLRIPTATKLGLEGEAPSRQLMSALFEQCLYILGDVVALRISERKGISDASALWHLHANLE